MKKAKIEAAKEGITLKEWFVTRLRTDLKTREAKPPCDDAVRFRKRFDGKFESREIDQFKRAGRA